MKETKMWFQRSIKTKMVGNDLSSERFSTNKQTKVTNKQNKTNKKVDRMVPLQRMTREQNKTKQKKQTNKTKQKI